MVDRSSSSIQVARESDVGSVEDTAPLISSEDENAGCCYTVCHPKGSCHRFIVLIFMCFLGFGSYFCYDNPAALENYFEKDLNITATEFTVLYSVYSWPNVVLCFIGGYLIDRVFGIRLGTNIYMALTLLGQVIFAAGALFNIFWIMCAGRFIFGIGGESLAVAQNNYAVLWFKGKELNMVFGLQLSFARVGSGVNFMVMESVYNWINNVYKGYQCLGIVLFIATFTCIFSMICSLVLGYFDRRAEKVLHRAEGNSGERVSLRDIKDFGLTFWLVCVVCIAYYVAIFPFIALGKDFFQSRFHFTPEEANRVNSVIYFFSAVASPVTGFFIDLTGKNITWILTAVAATIGAHALLAFTLVNPYVGMVIMGLGYSTLASSLWPLVSLMVPEYQLGTAYGVCQAVQNLGLAVVVILTGLIKDNFGFTWLEIFFIISLSVAFLATLVLWLADRHRNSILNMTPGQRRNLLLSVT